MNNAKRIEIINLMENYLNGDGMPKRIRYPLMQEGYQYFRWNYSEYVCETDEDCTLSVPWHHLMDEVEIV